jgi:hypothetical protein
VIATEKEIATSQTTFSCQGAPLYPAPAMGVASLVPQQAAKGAVGQSGCCTGDPAFAKSPIGGALRRAHGSASLTVPERSRREGPRFDFAHGPEPLSRGERNRGVKPPLHSVCVATKFPAREDLDPNGRRTGSAGAPLTSHNLRLGGRQLREPLRRCCGIPVFESELILSPGLRSVPSG